MRKCTYVLFWKAMINDILYFDLENLLKKDETLDTLSLVAYDKTPWFVWIYQSMFSHVIPILIP